MAKPRLGSTTLHSTAPSSVRLAVAATRRSMRGLEVQIQHQHGITRSSSGAITYAHNDSWSAFVEPVVKVVRDSKGVERVARARITFLFPLVVDTSDKFVLPDGTTGPVVEVVEGIADASNPTGCGVLTTVFLG